MVKHKLVEILLRIAVFGTFLGHGIMAFSIPDGWISLIKGFGFTDSFAQWALPYVGALDILVAVLVLIFPIRIIVIWAVVWAFMTALSRPISGMSMIEFIERSSNWIAPLALLFLIGYPKNIKDYFKINKS